MFGVRRDDRVINLLALLCEMFSCVFVTFSCGVVGQVCESGMVLDCIDSRSLPSSLLL